MADDTFIGPRLKIDGEKEFKQAIAAINKDMTVLGSEMKLVTAQFSKNKDSVAALTAQNQVYNKQIDEQKKKIGTIADALKNAEKEYGQNSNQVKEWQIKLNNAQGALYKLEQELDDNKKAISEHSKEVEDSSQKTNRWADSLKATGKVLGKGLATTAKASAVAIGAAMAAISGATIVAAKSVVSAGMEFEASLSGIKAVSGATEEEMAKLEEAAKKAGAETAFSASESADAIGELIKAGLTTEQVLGGGLTGALNLAAAGEIGVADAAEIASNVLNSFKADNLSLANAADILAGAANASATDVMGLKLGLSQASAVASGMGMSFEDTATALAVFAQNGLKGSDAGTSLKTMLMNLQPVSDKQTMLFERLGLMTEEGTSAFYDAAGSMKPLNEIAGLLNGSMNELTDAERAMALETMFGSDAVRAGNILFKEGAKGVTTMNEAMSKVTAAEVAAERLNNLKGALEALNGSVDTLKIQLYEGLQGPLTEMTKAATEMVNEIGTALADGFQAEDIKTIGQSISTKLLEGIKTFAKYIPDLVAMISDTLREIIKLIVKFIPVLLPPLMDAAIDLMQGVLDAIMDNIKPLQKVITELVLKLADFIIKNLPTLLKAAIQIVLAIAIGIADALPRLIPSILEMVDQIVDVLIDNLPAFIEAAIKITLAIGAGLIMALPKLLEQIPKIWIGIRNAFQNIDWGNIGKYIVDGIGDGLSSAAYSLIKSAKDLANSALRAIKKALKINSPSKVMADEVGLNMGLGVAEGLEKSGKAIDLSFTKAMPDFNRKLNFAVAANVSKAPAVLEIDYDRFEKAVAKAVAKQQVVIDGRSFGRLVKQYA